MKTIISTFAIATGLLYLNNIAGNDNSKYAACNKKADERSW